MCLEMKFAERLELRLSAATGVRADARVPQARDGPGGECLCAWLSLHFFSFARCYFELDGTTFHNAPRYGDITASCGATVASDAPPCRPATRSSHPRSSSDCFEGPCSMGLDYWRWYGDLGFTGGVCEGSGVLAGPSTLFRGRRRVAVCGAEERQASFELTLGSLNVWDAPQTGSFSKA